MYDEAWRLMSHPALLRRMDAHWRLARHSNWESVPAGQIGASAVFPDDSHGRLRVRMQIRTVYGTTTWGDWRAFRDLPRCH